MAINEITVNIRYGIKKLIGPFLILATAFIDDEPYHRQVMFFGKTILAWKVE